MKLIVYIFLFLTTLYGVTFEEATENFNKGNFIEAYDQYS